MSIGQEIRDAMEAQGLRVVDVASRAGVCRDFVYLCLHDGAKSLTKLRKVCQTLGIDVDAR